MIRPCLDRSGSSRQELFKSRSTDLMFPQHFGSGCGIPQVRSPPRRVLGHLLGHDVPAHVANVVVHAQRELTCCRAGVQPHQRLVQERAQGQVRAFGGGAVVAARLARAPNLQRHLLPHADHEARDVSEHGLVAIAGKTVVAYPQLKVARTVTIRLMISSNHAACW